MQRVVLGASEWARTFAQRATDRAGDTTLFAADEGFVERLREENVAATVADPTDPTAIPPAAAFVAVAARDPETTLAAAATAARRYPDATRLVVVPSGATADQRDRLANLGWLVDPHREVAEATLAAATGPDADRLRRLLATLRGVEEPLLVLAHDNPDPDAIAAAVTLVDVAERVGVAAEAGYFGDISHQENRALVNLLELELTEFDPADDVVSEFGSVALVDHAVAGVNDSLPPGTEAAVVIDHHPPTEPASAPFYDVRPELGATATMLVEYLTAMGIDPPEAEATALLYGIHVDTRDLVRGVTVADFEAAARLLPHVDRDVLRQVESPSVAAGVFTTLATAISNREVRGEVAVSCVGSVGDRDSLPQAADQLLALDGVRVAVVYGYADGTVYASGRARGAELDLGETFRDAFGSVGSAGGHADMAGAQLELGVLGETAGDERLRDVLEAAVSERFFEAVGAASRPPSPGGFLPVE